MSLLETISRWRGKRPPVFEKKPSSALVRDWTFAPTQASLGVRAVRIESLFLGLRFKPPARELKSVHAARAWTCYFVYAPDGELSESHRFTLKRLRQLERPLLVVCAAPTAATVPRDLLQLCDALWWKGLRGFDFSAYRIGLYAVAGKSPGADVFVLNDSVLGPFCDLDPILRGAKWDLTGFTGFALIENHIQSYAFQLRHVTHQRLAILESVLPTSLAFNDYQSVIYLQETRFARTAARHMSVGALWYSDAVACGDPTVFAGPDLLINGFPFLKRSLFGRNRHLYDQSFLQRLLQDRGHQMPVAARTA